MLDQTGLAQKGGAVTTHVRIAKTPADIHAVRIAAGEADLVLGCDMVVVNDYWALSKIRAGRSARRAQHLRGDARHVHPQPDMQFPAADIIAAVQHRARRAATRAWSTPPSSRTALMGDAIATNLFMLGYAWQQGLVPLSLRFADARDRAQRRRGRDEQDRRSPGAAWPRSIRPPWPKPPA